MEFLLGGSLVLFSLVLVISSFLGLPGNWLILGMVAATAWGSDRDPFGPWSFVVLGGLALVGEVFETLFGAVGARRLGGSRRGAVCAVVGGVIGAIVGTPLGLIVGMLAGAAIGAFLGSYLGDRWAGRVHQDAVKIGKAAATGRVLGTVAKVACGLAMVLWITGCWIVAWAT